jgi:hypothetical protein
MYIYIQHHGEPKTEDGDLANPTRECTFERLETSDTPSLGMDWVGTVQPAAGWLIDNTETPSRNNGDHRKSLYAPSPLSKR